MMLFVVKKRELPHAISVVRDDRKKRKHPGSFMRLEARHGFLSLSSWDDSAQIAATVYEEGVMFLRVKLLRLLLPTIKGSDFLEMRITDDELFLDNIRLSLAADKKSLYDEPPPKPGAVRVARGSHRQLRLWR